MTVFFVVGAVGLVLLVVTLIAGEVVEGIFDGIGGEWLSGAGLAGFIGAFGFAGALAYDLSGGSVGIGIVVGLLAGVAMGALVAVGTRFLRKEENDSTVRTASLVGRACSVSTPIPADGYGEVTLVAAGHITRLNARAAAPIPVGANVTITAILSATAVVVEPVTTAAPRVGQDVALDHLPPSPPPPSAEPDVDVTPPAGTEPPARRAAPEPEQRGPGFTPPEQTWSPWARDDTQR
ncbi:NfeD family protein [Desertihabitans aurantiacus]|uniref:NfeD family protein n=1 Tax=Desertihabitans aurantiacus TaxID=2282477 RepID=UPI000DF76A92|nr:NfeD family protein [Desertihabitans aurantiacus]